VKKQFSFKGRIMPISPKQRHDLDWQEKKKADDFYEDTSRYYDILEVIEQCSPIKLLDIGCGSGFLAKLLKSRIPKLVVDGIDISEVALKRAKEQLNDYWQVNIDQADLPLQSKSYDTTVCIEVLEHLYDPEHALKEIYRVLQPGGHAIITVPNLAYWRYRLNLMKGRVPLPAVDRRHLHQFDVSLFRQLLLQAGFQIEEVSGHAVLFPWLARFKPNLFSDILIATVRKD